MVCGSERSYISQSVNNSHRPQGYRSPVSRPQSATIVTLSSLMAALADDSLPLMPPSLSDFDRGTELFLGFEDVGGEVLARTSGP